MVIRIYGVRTAYNQEVIQWYRLRSMAEEDVKKSNKEHPGLEHRVVTSHYDDGEGE